MYRLSFFFIRIALIDLRDETVPGRGRCSRKETDLKSAEKVSKIPAVLSVNRSENSRLNALCFTFSLAERVVNKRCGRDANDASRRPATELFSETAARHLNERFTRCTQANSAVRGDSVDGVAQVARFRAPHSTDSTRSKRMNGYAANRHAKADVRIDVDAPRGLYLYKHVAAALGKQQKKERVARNSSIKMLACVSDAPQTCNPFFHRCASSKCRT